MRTQEPLTYGGFRIREQLYRGKRRFSVTFPHDKHTKKPVLLESYSLAEVNHEIDQWLERNF